MTIQLVQYRPLPGYYFYNVVDAGGVFVALLTDENFDTTYAARSLNGVDWQLVANLGGEWGYGSLAYGGGKVVAFLSPAAGNSGDHAFVAVSSDKGQSWSTTTFGQWILFNGMGYAVHNGTKFCVLPFKSAFGTNNGTSFTATNPTSWTAGTQFQTVGRSGIAWNGTVFLTGKFGVDDPCKAMSSSDGLAWTEQGAFPSTTGTGQVSWATVVASGSKFLAFKAWETNGTTPVATPVAARSTDNGATWSALTFPDTDNNGLFGAVNHNGSIIIAENNNQGDGNRLWISDDDGDSWSLYALRAQSSFVEGFAISNDVLVLVDTTEYIEVSVPNFWSSHTNCREIG